MSLDKIEGYVTKYMGMLGSRAARPKVVIRNTIASWLGLTKYTPSNPETTLITIQKSILDDEKTLERVVAHEIVHHINMMNMSKTDLALLKIGVKPIGLGHGPEFVALAKKINDVMGTDFVTKESDQTYVRKGKPFTVLIEVVPYLNNRLGWSWAVRLTDEVKEIIERKKREAKAKVVTVTDSVWTSGTKIKRFAGVTVPRQGTNSEKLLQDLYQNA